jgi:hypothetical protein
MYLEAALTKLSRNCMNCTVNGRMRDMRAASHQWGRHHIQSRTIQSLHQ